MSNLVNWKLKNFAIDSLSIKYFNQPNVKKRLKFEMSRINEMNLPDELKDVISKFYIVNSNGVLDDRKEFIWKWLIVGQTVIRLSSVPQSYEHKVLIIKLHQMIFAILLDDIADKVKDRDLLDRLIKYSIFNKSVSIPSDFKAYFIYTKEVWDYIVHSIVDLPSGKRIFKYFLDANDKFIECLYYSAEINTDPSKINLEKYYEILSHNMNVLLTGIVDLATLPNKKINEATMKNSISLFETTQKMARVGNWVSTWKREISDHDYTSGIFALLMDKELITENISEYKVSKLIKIILNNDLENEFIDHWVKFYSDSILKSETVHLPFDSNAYIDSFKVILQLHMGSIGLK